MHVQADSVVDAHLVELRLITQAIHRCQFAVMILTDASRLNSQRNSRQMESRLTKTTIARTDSERPDSLADNPDAMLNQVSQSFVFLRVLQNS